MDAATPDTERLVAEALAKSGLLWVTSDAGAAPCWHVQLKGIAYVVSGAGEQFSPEHVGRVSIVTRSKESRARLASFEAEASVVHPDDDDWEAATFALKAGRLNAPAGDVVERWRQEARVTRFVPDLSTVVVRGQCLPAPASPEPSPADVDAADAPHSGVGTVAPGSERPAAAAAERAHREVVRADEAPAGVPATSVESGDSSNADRVSE